MKCRWTHCSHESKDIPRGEAVKIGSSYYHADCVHEKQTIDEILKLWSERIDPNPVWNQLRSVVNTLIYKQHMSVDFIKFAVLYDTEHGHHVRYAPGLYYLVKDVAIQKVWERSRLTEADRHPVVETKPTEDEIEDFKRKPSKNQKFEEIFKK